MFFHHHHVNVTLDSGAESSLIGLDTAHRLDLKILPTKQKALQADGSNLDSRGEVTFTLTWNTLQFTLNAMVVASLDCEVLAGMPFLHDIEITINVPGIYIIVQNSHKIYFDTVSKDQNRRIMRSSQNSVIFPGYYIELNTHQDYPDVTVQMEPLNLSKPLSPNPEEVVTIVAGRIRLCNDTADPITIKKHEYIACVTPANMETVNGNNVPP
jgi:hypothetical protein